MQPFAFQAPEWYREDLVGQAIQDSRVPRNTVFLTTKLHPRHHGFNSTLRQMQTSFTNLDTDWLDLVLLHYPRQVVLIEQADAPALLVLHIAFSPLPPFPSNHTPHAFLSAQP